MWKKLAKWGLLIALLSYVAIMFVWSHSEAARHNCAGIEVEIVGVTKADSLTRRGVLQQLGGYPHRIIGAPIHTINTFDIASYLRQLSTFENVECLITSKGILKIQIVPMVPAIRVFENGKSYYVNKDGKRIDSKAEFFVDVPVVTGHFTKSFRPQDILPVVRFVTSDNTLNELTSMFVAKDADNIMLVPRIRGHIVNFGDTNRLEEKRRALLTAYKQILPYKGWETYDTISVKFRGQIVASRRDKSPLYPVTAFEEEVDPEEVNIPLPEGQQIGETAAGHSGSNSQNQTP